MTITSSERESLYTLLSDAAKPPDPPKPWASLPFLLFAGIWPFTVVLLELFTRFCANNMFDPLSTPFHIAAALANPLIAIWLFVDSRRAPAPGRSATAVGLGVCGGVSLFYAIAFLPAMPMAVIALMFAIGALPLAPAASFALTAINARRFHREFRLSPRFLVCGFLAALVWLAVAETHSVRSLQTVPALLDVRNPSRDRLLHFYRMPAMDSAIRRACDGLGPAPAQWFGVRRSFSPDACLALYAIHGKPLAAAALPVALDSTRIDTTVHPATATQYQEWNMEFRSVDGNQQEASGAIRLPAGGVVSRVTLWINGEEREAAFGGKEQVTAAYQAVTAVKRDPLLVTTRGDGTVDFKCFPVPSVGTMRIRLGITAPLTLLGPTRARTAMPALSTANFSLAAVSLPPPYEVDLHPDPAQVRIVDHGETAPAPLILVVDGSAGMYRHAAAIESLAAKLHARVLLATHAVPGYIETRSLRNAEMAGGVDNGLALEYATRTAPPGSRIVWLHGYYPYRMPTPPPLSFNLDEDLNIGHLEQDLAAATDRPRYRTEWLGDAPNLQKLKAADEVSTLLANSLRSKALALATRHRIVTPVSGAVVLETREQYKRFGLTDPRDNVNTPEPSTWILTGLGLASLALARRKRRQEGGVQHGR